MGQAKLAQMGQFYVAVYRAAGAVPGHAPSPAPHGGARSPPYPVPSVLALRPSITYLMRSCYTRRAVRAISALARSRPYPLRCGNRGVPEARDGLRPC